MDHRQEGTWSEENGTLNKGHPGLLSRVKRERPLCGRTGVVW